MQKAHARKLPDQDPVDALFDEIIVELVKLHESLPLEEYLGVIEDFTDQARASLAQIPDPGEKDRLRDQYRQVISFAMDLTCGNLH